MSLVWNEMHDSRDNPGLLFKHRLHRGYKVGFIVDRYYIVGHMVDTPCCGSSQVLTAKLFMVFRIKMHNVQKIKI